MSPENRPRRRLKQGKLADLVGYQLRRAQIRVFHHFRASAGNLDLSPGQYGTLLLIAANPGCSQSDLSTNLRVDRSTIVAVIDRLEQRRLVERAPSPVDRRSYALQLSALGAETVAQMTAAVAEHERAITANLTEQERRQLLDLLVKVAAD